MLVVPLQLGKRFDVDRCLARFGACSCLSPSPPLEKSASIAMRVAVAPTGLSVIRATISATPVLRGTTRRSRPVWQDHVTLSDVTATDAFAATSGVTEEDAVASCEG